MTAAVEMPAVFGEAQPDDDQEEQPRRPILFHAHAHAQGLLRVVATDLHSLAWHRSLALPDIHDLVRKLPPIDFSTPFHSTSNNLLMPNLKQDDVGIAGSCSDFLDYLYSSLSSGHVKLVCSSSGILFISFIAIKLPT
jgi:hypothetical protein